MSTLAEERMRRITEWENRNNKQMQNLTEKEWIEAAQEIFAMTKREAEEYLTHLQMQNRGMKL